MGVVCKRVSRVSYGGGGGGGGGILHNILSWKMP